MTREPNGSLAEELFAEACKYAPPAAARAILALAGKAAVEVVVKFATQYMLDIKDAYQDSNGSLHMKAMDKYATADEIAAALRELFGVKE